MWIDRTTLFIEGSRSGTSFTSGIEILLTAEFLSRQLANSCIGWLELTENVWHVNIPDDEAIIEWPPVSLWSDCGESKTSPRRVA